MELSAKGIIVGFPKKEVIAGVEDKDFESSCEFHVYKRRTLSALRG